MSYEYYRHNDILYSHHSPLITHLPLRGTASSAMRNFVTSFLSSSASRNCVAALLGSLAHYSPLTSHLSPLIPYSREMEKLVIIFTLILSGLAAFSQPYKRPVTLNTNSGYVSINELTTGYGLGSTEPDYSPLLN